MKKSLFLGLMIIFSLLALSFAGCGGGDDDDDDSSSPTDDDAADDTTGDDDATDDTGDDVADDTSDDTTPDDDIAYDSLICGTPDPMTLGADKMIGGGSISTTIDVYVYDDATCAAIAGATVSFGGSTYTTDADGHVALTSTTGAQMVTASATDHWAWTYKADAAVMYFRLRPGDYGRTYADSSDGDFTTGGAPVDLDATNLGNLFSAPVYLGIAAPGLPRSGLLSLDFEGGLMAEGTFDLTLNTGSPEVTPLPKNIFLPGINVSVVGYGVTGSNPHYALPVETGAAVSPTEGFVAGVDVSAAIPGITQLGTIILCIVANPDDILGCISDLITPLLNDGLGIDYIGADPTWDGTGAPDIETVQPSSSLSATITNADADFDYLGILAAEIPNRAILPTGLGVAESGTVALDYAEYPDSTYVAVMGATDLISSGFASLNFSFAMKYTDDIADWTGGVAFNGSTEFLPVFDGTGSSYNGTTGEVTWALESGGLTPDLFQVVIIPDCSGCPVVLAQVPGTDGAYLPPVADLGITPSADDIVVVVALKLPAGTDINAYNTTGILGYNSAAVSVWTNYVLAL